MVCMARKRYALIGISDTQYFCRHYQEGSGECTRKNKDWGKYSCDGCRYLDEIEKPGLVPLEVDDF